jgi:hypothetical protein
VSYLVHTGLYGCNTATFGAFPEALEAYSTALAAHRSSSQVENAWERPSLTGSDVVDGEDDGLTDDERELVESLSSPLPAFPICGHAVFTAKREEKRVLCRCDNCGHSWAEMMP